MAETGRSIGTLLREWRQLRRISQLELAYDAGTSARHISFLETGRALPSRDMIFRLAKQLKVPVREWNSLLLAAGFAPEHKIRSLDEPALAPAKRAIEQFLKSHEPYPAMALDRHWNVVASNPGGEAMLSWASSSLLQPPVNIFRVAYHPDGLSGRILNLESVKAGSLARLRQQIRATADPTLKALLEELNGYPPQITNIREATITDSVLARIRFQAESGVLSFFSATTVFGTPMDITLSEIAIESYFPADEQTAAA